MSAKTRVPDWLLERLAKGELPAAKERELRARLAQAGETDRLSALAASDAEILAALPPARVVPEIERRAASAVGPRRVRRTRPILALSMVAAGAAVLAVLLLPHRPDYDGIKGLKPSLRIHRKTPTGAELLPAGGHVRQGDTLQLRYVAAGRRFGVVASVDARGTVTLHLPESPGPAAALHPDGERALAHAFELDDSPGFERFVFVTSNSSFGTAEVTQALAGRRPVPAKLTTFELTLKKDTP